MIRLGLDPETLAEFCLANQISRLSLFGSILGENFRPDSDVDVLVELDPAHPWSLFDVVDMQEELTALLGRSVDLVMKGGLRNPIRRKEILETRRVIYHAA